ncbi:hypothetical protein [Sphingomonas prati]|uniref:Glycerophosphoryl diester phosphodiesterase membrane domain-containing protein n=1 Tax=Sphingomonas prati TaxID=1843237 RepID=A0A7W9BT11_9SPHN|nr:hypothetical protein [Sphingomonas prati]MBB5729576.1 hypothetical protein [Sphingomonas prati]GGE76385.1 hypothetical protein GCM10011404_06290 [Sphingomonas prati]
MTDGVAGGAPMPARADVGTVIERTLAGLWREWRAVLVAAAVLGVIGLASGLLIQPMMMREMVALSADAASISPRFIVGASVAALLASLVCIAVVVAAMRLAFTPGEPVRLRFGGTELRVLATMLLLGLGIYLLMVVAMIVLIAVAAAAGAALGGVGILVAIVAGLLALIVPFAALYCGVRLSLAVPLAAQRGRFALREAWRLGRGRFWFLFLAYILLFLMGLVALVPGLTVQMGDMTAVMAAGQDPVAVQRAWAELAAAHSGAGRPLFLLGVVLSGLGNGVLLALQGRMSAELVLALQSETAMAGTQPIGRPG